MPSIGSSAKSLDNSAATAKHSSSRAASSGVTGMANAVCRKSLAMFRLLDENDGIKIDRVKSARSPTAPSGLWAGPAGERKFSRAGLDRRPLRQPVGDFVVGKIFEKLLDRADAGLIDKNNALAAMLGWPGIRIHLTGETAIVGMCAGPYQVELLFARQAGSGRFFMFDDRRTHRVGAAA